MYDFFFQVKFSKNGVIRRGCSLMSGSIHPAPPCACIEATFGSDKATLSDTEFEFIRINGDMDTEVSYKPDLKGEQDSELVATPSRLACNYWLLSLTSSAYYKHC